MSKNFIALGVLFISICIIFSGCGEIVGTVTSEEDKFIGVWVTDSIYDRLVFSSDGRCRKFRYDGTWSVHNGKITLTYAIVTKPYNYTYNYSFGNNTLTLTNVDSGISMIYTKQ
jgi:hypothetical protein